VRLLKVTKIDDALKLIKDSFSPLETEEVTLEKAGGRYCAEEIIASEDVPAFNRSTVDGYAVRAEETFGATANFPSFLELAGIGQMGEEAGNIGSGQCFYVPTGGMLPLGADAVVMVEETEEVEGLVQVFKQVAPGENVIRRGEDLSCGQVVLGRGRKIRGPELGLLGSLGITRFKVYRRPLVGILSTGDELTPVETPSLKPGQIRDANGVALFYLCRQAGAEAVNGGIIPDQYDAFAQRIKSLLAQVDMVVLSGGSSVGTRDYTPAVLQELSGGELLLEGLAVKPGKPTILARCDNKPVLGLPGHPVSALNIFSLLGQALINRLSGAAEEEWRPSIRAVLTKNVPSRPGRIDLVRVSLQKTGNRITATPIFGRSGLLNTMALADGVIQVGAELDGLAAGAEVEVFIWE